MLACVTVTKRGGGGGGEEGEKREGENRQPPPPSVYPFLPIPYRFRRLLRRLV